MDTDKSTEPDRRWVAESRSLARRVSSAMPERVTGRMQTPLALLLAVGFLGGLRIGGSESWLAPPLGSLVLAAMILGALDRHGAIAVKRLLHSSRSAIDLYGLLVILTIVFASAQAIHVTIATGSLRSLFYLLFFLPLLALNTRLVAADHARMLWILVVTFGAAFTVNFVVLPAMTFGAIWQWLCKILPGCQPQHPATGYLTFVTLLLYLAALAGLARMTRDAPGSSPADRDGDPEPEESQPEM